MSARQAILTGARSAAGGDPNAMGAAASVQGPLPAPAPGHRAAHGLDFDFAGARRRVSLTGLALLLAGACVAVVTALDYVEADATMQQVQQQHDRLQRVARPTARRVPVVPAPQQADALREADRMQGQLQRPWDAVLRGIEQHSNAGVALLSLDAQGAAGTWRLAAEARSMPEALAYASQLRSLAVLRSVELVGHEWRDVQGAPVLRFVLELRWSTLP
jgi:hypothetical protein